MPFKAGHLFKLVPVAIGGTYSAYPSFLPTEPKDVEKLFSERKCYTAANDEKRTKYLFACTTDPLGKTLDFFYLDTSSEIAVPVKSLKLSDRLAGGGETDKKLDLSFIWGGKNELEIKSYYFPQFPWLNKEGDTSSREFNLTTYCGEYEITSITFGGPKTILKCKDWSSEGGQIHLGWLELQDRSRLRKIRIPPKGNQGTRV